MNDFRKNLERHLQDLEFEKEYVATEEHIKDFQYEIQKLREWRGENPTLESALNHIFFGKALTVAECYALDIYIDKLENLLLDKERNK